MPKRWLSRNNGRYNNDRLIISSPKGPVLHDNTTFDFAFTDLQPQKIQATSALPPLPSATFGDVRPTTSAGVISRARKQLRVDVLPNRPRSSDGTLSPTVHPKSTHRRSRSGGDFIGVAFGSPGHPPMAFCNDNGNSNSTHFDSAFGGQGPFHSEARLQPAKWKKLGNLFRNRPGLIKGRISSSGLREDYERSNEPGPRHHWHKQQAAWTDPVRVPPSIRIDREQPQKLHDGSNPKTVLDLRPSAPVAASGSQAGASKWPVRKQSSLPRIDTDPPGLRTMVFTNSSSSLLTRRSKTLENLKATTFLRVSTDDESEHEESPRFARRQTTPTMSRSPMAETSTDSPATNKYSLFPSTTSNTGRSPLRTRLERSHTSPARLSPAQQKFPGPCPAQARRGVTRPGPTTMSEQPTSSPEEHTASTTRTMGSVWSKNHSKDSSISSANTADMEEIFFDMKPFRDSSGLEKNDHFVLTRPDSVAVSLARTRSKLNGQGRPAHLQRTSSLRSHQRSTSKSTVLIPLGKTPEETSQMRVEGEKLREIEERVQREVAERRQKFLNGVPQIPTPNVNEGRFSVSTAIFDETIAAVEAMSVPASKVPGTSQNSARTAQNGMDHTLPLQATVQGHSKQSSLSMKLLPPDPGMPHPRHVQEGSEKPAPRGPQGTEADRPRPDSGLLSVEPVVPRNTRTPSPNPPKTQAGVTPKQVLPAKPRNARDKAPSPDVQRKPLPASSDALVEKYKAESPALGTHRAVSSVYSQASPASTGSRPTFLGRLRSDRPIEESPTIPQSPGPGKHNPNRATLKEKPPPVPKKDAKFIPISKFAAQSTLAKIEQAGVRPTRAIRSVTDSALSSPMMSKTPPTGFGEPKSTDRVRPVRSETMPGAANLPSMLSYRPSPQLAQQMKGSPQLTVVQAQPTTEVSVARTVSLARKQSARVNIATPKLQARRQEEEARIKAEQSQHAHNEPTSQTERPGPSFSRPTEPTGLGLLMGDEPVHSTQHHKNESNSSIDRKPLGGPGPLNSNPSTPDHVTSNPIDTAEHSRVQKAAIVEAAKARARARRRAESETREQQVRSESRSQIRTSATSEDVVKRYRDSQDEDEKSKWDLVENKNSAMSPLMVAGHRGHKVGVSMNVVFETA